MNEIWLHIQAFFEILSTRNVLIEVGVLAVCLLLGGLVGLELSRRNERQANKPPMALSWRYFGTQGNVVVTPDHRGAGSGHDRQQHAAGGAFRRDACSAPRRA